MLLTERHRWVPWAALVPTLSFATAAQWLVATSSRPLLFLVLDTAAGVLMLLVGAYLWWRRPANRVGPLLFAAGVAWFVGSFRLSRNPDVATVAEGLQGYADVILAWVVLAFPTGRLGSRSARAVVAALVGLHAARSFARVFLSVPPDSFGCDCTENRFLGRIDPRWFEFVSTTFRWLYPVALLAGAVVVIGRFRRAGRPTRALAGVSVGAWALLAAGRIYDYTIRESTPFIPGTADFYTTSYVESLARAGIALGVLAGLTLLSRRRGPAMELIGRLGQGETRSSAAVSAALRDPGLDILTWSDADSAFVDEGGVVVRDPSDAGRRAVTTLESGGRVVAAIRHDPALLEDPVLLESVAAALRLSVDNDRLAAELSERLRDVEASRKRIVEAADAERRRIEHNLHDGAQQQLLAAALALRMLEARHRDDPDLTAALRKATTTLTHALEDLRRLARGIHPAVLEEAGLAAALEGLSDSLAVPLDVHNHLPEPPPEAIATTLFYVAAEAVANVAKHARATRADIDLSLVGGRLRMVVSDDGVGGAAPAGGSGLQGMQDRILAIGGRIAIESPPGGGTRVTVEVPCE